MTPRLSWLLLLLLLRRPPAPPLPPFQPLTPEQLAWQEGEVTTLIHFNMATFDTEGDVTGGRDSTESTSYSI